MAKIKCPEITPHICDSIKGNGNCLFRAISKETTGTQKNHGAIREAIINFMEHPQNAQAFGALLFPQSPDAESAIHNISTYIDKSKMRQNSAWGTEKEITVAATLFQADILIFSKFGRGRKWLCFSPAFCNHTCTLKRCSIKLHLYHTKSSDHYHRVIPKLCS